jgi:predicted secreted protein
LNDAQEIHLKVGGAARASLPGLGSAGYRWQRNDAGGESVVRVTGRYAGLPGPEGTPSSASRDYEVTFEGMAPGEATVGFSLRRPWEEHVQDSRQFRVVVTP